MTSMPALAATMRGLLHDRLEIEVNKYDRNGKCPLGAVLNDENFYIPYGEHAHPDRVGRVLKGIY
jgi:hypothetical protein